MKVVSNDFKNNIIEYGRQIDARMSATDSDNIQTIIDGENIYSIDVKVKGSLLKSLMRELDFTIDNDLNIGDNVTCELGVLNADSEFEYLNFGNFIIESKEHNENENTYSYVAYDNMLKSMVDYVSLENATFPMSVKDYFIAICNQLGLEADNGNFSNSDKMMASDYYQEQEFTYRDIFDDISEVAGGSVIADLNGVIRVIYPSETNEVIDEECLKDINVKFKQKYGPINSIVLSRSAESDNVYSQDENSIAENGLCELKIIDNEIMNYDDRADYLPALLNRLGGLYFYINNYETIGNCYFDYLDVYNVSIDNQEYKCLILNDEISITQGLSEKIYTEQPEETDTDYKKSDVTDRRINKVRVLADKINREIELLVSEQAEQKTTLTQILQDITGIQAIFQLTGGSNLIKNSQFMFSDEVWEFNGDDEDSLYYHTELGAGYNAELIGKTVSNANIILRNIDINTTNDNIINLIPGKSYTLNYYYDNDNNTETTVRLVSQTTGQTIFEKVYNTAVEFEQETFTFTAQDSKYIFSVSTETETNGYFRLYDLMLNSGDKKDWEQGTGESFTNNLKMSNYGLQIFNSGSKLLTLITSQGFQVRNSNSGEAGEIITEFTNTGLKTGVAEMKSAKIGKFIMTELEFDGETHHVEYFE